MGISIFNSAGSFLAGIFLIMLLFSFSRPTKPRYGWTRYSDKTFAAKVVSLIGFIICSILTIGVVYF